MTAQFCNGRFGQGNSTSIDGGTHNTFKIPYPAKLAAGACIFLAMHTDNANTVSTISDNINGSWSTTADRTVTGANETLALYKKENSGAADPANGTGLIVTVVFTGQVNPPITWLQAWAGIKSSGSADGGNTAASQVLNGTGTVATTAFTPTTNNDANGGHLILTFASVDSFTGSNPALTNIAASGTGLTVQSAFIDWPAGGGPAPHASSAGIQAANGSITPGFTLTSNNNSDTWNIITQAYLIDSTQGSPPSGTYVSSYDFHFVNPAVSAWVVQSPLRAGDFPVVIGANAMFTSVTDSQGNTWNFAAADAAAGSDTVGQVWYPPIAGLTTPDSAFKITGHNATPPAQFHYGVLHMRGVTGAIGANAFQTTPVTGSASIQHDPDITPTQAGSIIALAGPTGIGPELGISNPSNAVFLSMIFTPGDDSNTENSGDAWGYFLVTGAMVGVSQNVTWTMPSASFTGSISTTVLTVNASGFSGVMTFNETISGTGVTANTIIQSLGTGTGGAGTYNVNNSQTVGSEAMTALLISGPQAHAVEFLPSGGVSLGTMRLLMGVGI